MSALRRFFLARKAILAAPAQITGCFSRPSSGLPAPVRRGATCLSTSAIGTRFGDAFDDGRSKASSNGSSTACPMTDFEYVIIDGTIVRVHQHGTGAKGGLK